MLWAIRLIKTISRNPLTSLQNNCWILIPQIIKMILISMSWFSILNRWNQVTLKYIAKWKTICLLYRASKIKIQIFKEFNKILTMMTNLSIWKYLLKSRRKPLIEYIRWMSSQLKELTNSIMRPVLEAAWTFAITAKEMESPKAQTVKVRTKLILERVKELKMKRSFLGNL